LRKGVHWLGMRTGRQWSNRRRIRSDVLSPCRYLANTDSSVFALVSSRDCSAAATPPFL
jgi:hypothetical protein